MKNTKKRNVMSLVSLVMVLLLSMSLMACNKKTEAQDASKSAGTVVNDTVVTENADTNGEEAANSGSVVNATEVTEVGEGAVSFTFEVVDGEGATSYFTVNTDKATVGEALLDNGLVEGEDGEYGLYVKKVNGITADYDVDQTYWAFYVDGEYATSGVDSTDVVAGSTYSFKVEK